MQNVSRGKCKGTRVKKKRKKEIIKNKYCVEGNKWMKGNICCGFERLVKENTAQDTSSLPPTVLKPTL